MAYYNPNRVEFNPNTMTIQAVGSVGRSLWDIYKHNVEKGQAQAKLDETNRSNLASEAQAAANLAETKDYHAKSLKNQMDTLNWQKDKYAQDQEKWAQEFDFKKMLESSRLAEAAQNNEFNRWYKETMLQSVLDARAEKAQAAREKEEEKVAQMQGVLNLPNYAAQDGVYNSLKNRLGVLSNNGKNSYMDYQGLLDGTWENVKGLVGFRNNNNENDNIVNIMKDDLYRRRVRRDTAYNKEAHDKRYSTPSALAPQVVNRQDLYPLINDYVAEVEADINEHWNKQLEKNGNLKNPYLNQEIEAKRQADLADFAKQKAAIFKYYGINDNNDNSVITGGYNDNNATRNLGER